MQTLAKLTAPLVALVDRFAGDRVGMLIEVELEGIIDESVDLSYSFLALTDHANIELLQFSNSSVLEYSTMCDKAHSIPSVHHWFKFDLGVGFHVQLPKHSQMERCWPACTCTTTWQRAWALQWQPLQPQCSRVSGFFLGPCLFSKPDRHAWLRWTGTKLAVHASCVGSILHGP